MFKFVAIPKARKVQSPLKFIRFCLSRIVMRTSPHKHRVCAVLFPRSPCEFARLCVSFRYAYFASQTSGLCSACTLVPFGIFMRVFLWFAYFASLTPGLRSAFPLAPFEFVRLCLSYYVIGHFASQTSGLCSVFPSVPL